MSGPDEDRSLEDLVVECLERVEAGGEGAVEAFLAEHPARAAELRARLEQLRAVGLLSLARAARSDGFPERLGDFRLLRRLGEGGMGVVYLAEQVSLGRRVALKLIRPEQLYFSGSRERFRREVEAVARLSHPGIVPVHTFGEEAGIPYYAMEHVEGVSLADAIAAFRGRAPATLRGHDLRGLLPSASDTDSSSADRRRFEGGWVECALGIARDVAAALQHAHERGVLHRDVKPSNVMLTRSGRVVLLDFGLAALQGSERLTRSGAQLGSLAYMAPEQIDGRVDEIGPATDVYALGVTLRELLTLDLPYLGATPEETLRRIVESDPEPMRRRNALVSGDVETLVATATDRDPARRYASAEALARDLGNVLERRPIAARRASAALRTRRWIQRHPAGATAIALSAILLVGVPTLYAVQQRESRIEVGLQADLARKHLASALEAVDLLTRVGEEDLEPIPQAEEARRKLLESALGFYRRLAEERRDLEGIGRETALAEARVGEIQLLLGHHPEAREALARAVTDLEGLGPGAATDETRARLVKARLALAVTEGSLGNRAASQAILRRTIADLEERSAPGTGSAADRFGLANAHAKLADELRLSGDGPGAAAELETAIAILGPVVDEGSEADASRLEVRSLARLAQLQVALGDPDAGIESLRRAAGRLEAAPARPGREHEVAEDRSIVEWQWARLEDTLGRQGEAREHALRSVELHTALDRDYPGIARYREQLAVSTSLLGSIDARRGDLDAAAPSFERAIELLADLCTRFPETPSHAVRLAGVESCLLQIHQRRGRLEEASTLCGTALGRVERVLSGNPGDAMARETRDDLWLRRSELLLLENRIPEALESLPAPEDLDPVEYLVAFARLAATASGMAGASFDLGDEERDRAAEEGRAVVLRYLRRAVERGLRDRTRIDADPAFEELRDDPELRAVLEPLGEER